MKWSTSDLQKNWGIFRSVPEYLLEDIRLFHVFPICDGYMCSSLSAIFVTNFEETFGLGRNRCGMLGFCKGDALPDPVLIKRLIGVHLQAIETGLMHTMGLTDDGTVWTWGLDVDEPYSYPVKTTPPTPCEWLSQYKVLQIACGSYFNLALTDTYTVMYWGYYDITHSFPLRRPISFLGEPSILSLSSGLLFSAAVGSSGTVYTWTGPKREAWTCSPDMATFEINTKVSDVPLGRTMSKKEKPLHPRAINFPENQTGFPLKVVCTMRSLYILMDSGQICVTGHIPKSFERVNKVNKDITPNEPGEFNRCNQVQSITCGGYPVDILGTKWMDNIIVECTGSKNFKVFNDNIHNRIASDMAEAFANSPTPMMGPVHDDLDVPVHVPPRLDFSKEIFGSEFLSDVKFQLADNEVIHAHKFVLFAHSGHFKNMYGGEWKEKQADVIDVSKYNPIAYKAFLWFLYSGKLDDKLEVLELMELYQLADQYLDCALKKLCLKEITSKINSTTALELYDWALTNDLREFARKVIDYCSVHREEVLKSDSFVSMEKRRREAFVNDLFSSNG